ncbi:MAG: colanic acid biosynthesis acetyltransferase WcaF, partial [Flavobacteriales bacterium]|nr:colanic acid biosynthesis acetyltransferase WcaF [Flavobacteriales bacterium]
NNDWFEVGRPKIVVLVWYVFNTMVLNSYLIPISFLKRVLLRVFGAEIGKGVVIKPKVNIKYPWKLRVGDNTWIGENVWIDNLDLVEIGANVCISQGALILSGNHDYTNPSFNLIVKPIRIEEGVWIGAKSIVTQGVICKSHSILSVNSVANGNLEAYSIYKGNPAEKIRDRELG